MVAPGFFDDILYINLTLQATYQHLLTLSLMHVSYLVLANVLSLSFYEEIRGYSCFCLIFFNIYVYCKSICNC